jgi:hypothetical protein
MRRHWVFNYSADIANCSCRIFLANRFVLDILWETEQERIGADPNSITQRMWTPVLTVFENLVGNERPSNVEFLLNRLGCVENSVSRQRASGCCDRK